jgi:processive 1,2-diacylglycerol beta-glucosyltransferase
MMNNKKILILYATAGAGHKKAAEAIFAAALKDNPSVSLKDIVTFMPPCAARLYSDGYTFLIRRLPWIWGLLYFLSDTPALRALNVHVRRFVNRLTCKSLITFLRETKPDIVISTQFLASEIVSYAKQALGLPITLITVVTDFGVHNFWLAPQTDIYCCASEVTRRILLKKGVADSAIRITGIPLDQKFLNVASREACAAGIAVDKDAFTALIVTGGIGAGPIEEIVDLLKDDIQLLVVCGNNNVLYQKLKNKNYGNVRVFGFVDTIPDLMRASDVVITKSGGLTVTEGLAMGKPMVFFFLIPGQESINAHLIENLRAGIIAATPKRIKEAVMHFKNDRAVYAAFSQRAQSLAKPHSSSEIIALIWKNE